MNTQSSAPDSLVTARSSGAARLKKNILTLAVLQALACGGVAQATTITVDSAADADPAVTDGVCTLREALEAANTDTAVDTCTAGAGADTIVFDPALSGSTVTLGGSQLVIGSDVTVDGDINDDGTADVTVDGNNTSSVFYIDAAAAPRTVTIDGLNITGGYSSFGRGAGVACRDQCDITIRNSTISGNTLASGNGAGVYIYSGSLGLSNTTVSNNTTSSSSCGGGIYTQDAAVNIADSVISGNTAGDGGGLCADRGTGTFSLTNSTVSGNTASVAGGGIYEDAGGTTLVNSTLTGNTADVGAGIYLGVGSNLTATDSTISNNTAVAGAGGGIYARRNLNITLTGSVISGNSSTDNGGGIYGGSNFTFTLTNSKVSNNTSGTYGGGIYVSGPSGNLVLTDSTVSGNTAVTAGGGIYGDVSTYITLTASTVSANTAGSGGGIHTRNDVTMTNSTVSGNTASSGTGGGINLASTSSILTLSNSTITGNAASTDGGGIYGSKYVYGSTTYAPQFIVSNTILAGNTVGGASNDCGGAVIEDAANSGNLVTDGGTACGITPALTADPMLGPLASNGGPTQTHLPQSGSPVLDAGDNTSCGTGLTVVTDQRGVPRDDGACDIGAVEGTTVFNPASIQFDSAAATVSEAGTSITLTVTRSGDTNNTVSVDFATADDTATAPADYTADSNTLLFTSGVTTQTITISITDDTDVEADEDFTVMLSNPQVVSGGAVEMGAVTSATVTIADNDSTGGSTTGTGTNTTTSSSNDGIFGIGPVNPLWLLMAAAGWLGRRFRR